MRGAATETVRSRRRYGERGSCSAWPRSWRSPTGRRPRASGSGASASAKRRHGTARWSASVSMAASAVLVSNVSRARGLALSLAEPLGEPRAGSVEEVAAEIAELLRRALDELLGD